MECYVTCYTAFTNNDKEPVGLAQWPRALALEGNLGSLPSTDMVATVLGDLVPSPGIRHTWSAHIHKQAKHAHI